MYRSQGSVVSKQIRMTIKLPYMTSRWYHCILNGDLHANKRFEHLGIVVDFVQILFYVAFEIKL